jgi:cytidine deaminase
MEKDLPLLSEELKKCFTPVSGKKVVSLIETDNNVYLGHNVEVEYPLWFFHAEEMAMAKMLDVESTSIIKRVVMWGSESSDSFKNITMCFDCFQKLSLFMNDETNIEIIHPDITKDSLKLKITDFQDAYGVQPETMILGNAHEQIVSDLKEKTPLVGIDLDFVADLRLLGLKKKISFLLIGSSAGKGGTSKIIINKTGRMYSDIDLIAITSENPGVVECNVLEIINKYYESCTLTRKDCPVPSKYTTRLKRKFNCKTKDGKSRLIELDIGSNIGDVLHKPEYVERNWFHYLST